MQSVVRKTPKRYEEYKNRLLDTGKRNKMINYRETKRATLRILDPKYDELFNQLALEEKSLSFQRPLDRDNDLRAYSVLSLMESLSSPIEVNIGDIAAQGTPRERTATLRNLRAKAKLAMEEQGINFLYLSFGFIEWQEKTVPGAPWLKSPLIMMPVTLSIESINAPYMLSRYDDDIEVNPTLDFLFSKDYGVELPVFELEDENSIVSYMDKVERIADQRGWKLLREVNLGLVSFLKISMYHDLEKHEDKALSNPVIRAMCGDEKALPPVNLERKNPDSIAPSDCYQVLSADSSQQEAVQLSKEGVSFVMQGPPGTGKSQTITNIIAEAMADGKRILFVSEKAAALQVVMRRLQETQLSDFCLSLHSHKANKRELLEQLRKCLTLDHTRVREAALAELARILADRTALNRYTSELHEVIPPLEESLYSAFGKYASLSHAAEVRVTLPDPVNTTEAQYHMMLLCATKLEEALKKQSCAVRENPWRNTTADFADAEYQYMLRSRTDKLREQLLSVRELTRRVPLNMLAENPSIDDAQHMVEFVEKMLSLSLFDEKWIDETLLEKGIEAAHENDHEQATLNDERAWLSEKYRDPILNLPVGEKRKVLAGGIRKIQTYESWKNKENSEILEHAQEINNYASRIIERYKRALEYSHAIANMLHRHGLITFDVLKKMGLFAAHIQQTPHGLKYQWFDDGKVHALLTLEQYEQQAEIISKHRAALLNKWQESTLEIDVDKVRTQLQERFFELFGTKYDDKDIQTFVSQQKEELNKAVWVLDKIEKNPSQVRAYIGNLIFPDTLLTESIRDNAQSCLELVIEKHKALQIKEDEILKDWEPQIFDLDADSILTRYKTEYTGFFDRLFHKKQYDADTKAIRSASRQIIKKIEEDKAILLLQNVREVQQERKWFDEHSEEIECGVSSLKDAYKQGLKICEGLLELYAEVIAHAVNAEAGCSLSEVREMLDDVFSIRESVQALMKNAAEYDLAFGSETTADEPLWLRAIEEDDKTYGERIRRGIEFAQTVRSWYDDRKVPQDIVESLCAIEEHHDMLDTAAQAAKALSEDEIAKLITDTRKAIPVSEDKLPTQALDDINALNRAASVIIEVLDQIEPHTITDIQCDMLLEDMEHIETIQTLYGKAREKEERNTQLFGEWYVGEKTPWIEITHRLEEIRSFITFAKNSKVPTEFITRLCNSGENRENLQGQENELKRLLTDSEEGLDLFVDQFEEAENLKKGSLDELIERYDACMNGFVQLSELLELKDAEKQCEEQGLGDFAAKILERGTEGTDIVDILKREFYRQWIKAVLEKKNIVRKFRRSEQDARIRSFCELDEEQLAIAQQRIREKILKKYPDPSRPSAPGDEMSILKHELNKKARIMPIRRLFREIPNLLLTLKPCFMMSPLSVSYFLEADSYKFDMIIFDEASQIFPQDALGSIMRGKQVIIAGDTKQMPPTNFFASGMNDGEDDYDGEDDVNDEPIGDSILEEADRILPNSILLWHYRSRSESLIAYSNQEIYKNELITFPGNRENQADLGVEFIYVPDGCYEAKPKNCNIAEAKRCVELIRQHIEQHPERSLGVIAFSEKQQQVILTEVEKFRIQNPHYETFFDENRDEPFFVKNLENVQGDERDTILFSVCYAYTKEQKENGKPMSMRFGPLGLAGGERRLNVAITRAKRNIKLVSSIMPEDLKLERTKSEGVRMLRGYMEFALKGVSALREAGQIADEEELIDAVTDFIEKNGYRVRKHVGCSGYKIDIAVEHPNIPDCFAAAIECDGQAYRAAETARDRDHLRPAILTGMGWSVYRVWSVEWCRNPLVEQQLLLKFIETACNKVTVMPKKTKNTSPTAPKKPEVLVENIQTQMNLGPDDGRKYGFVYMRQADWRNVKNNGKSEKDRFMEMIRYVVSVEQPIHLEILYRRLLGALGKAKMTPSVKETIDAYLKLMNELTVDSNGFVTRRGFNQLMVRIPDKGDEQRTIEMIAPQELELAVQLVALNTIGLTKESLLDETARALGYQRKGAKIQTALRRTFDSMVKKGMIIMVDGKVNEVKETRHG